MNCLFGGRRFQFVHVYLFILIASVRIHWSPGASLTLTSKSRKEKPFNRKEDQTEEEKLKVGKG